MKNDNAFKYFKSIFFNKDENSQIEINLKLAFKLYSCWKRKAKTFLPNEEFRSPVGKLNYVFF